MCRPTRYSFFVILLLKLIAAPRLLSGAFIRDRIHASMTIPAQLLILLTALLSAAAAPQGFAGNRGWLRSSSRGRADSDWISIRVDWTTIKLCGRCLSHGKLTNPHCIYECFHNDCVYRVCPKLGSPRGFLHDYPSPTPHVAGSFSCCPSRLGKLQAAEDGSAVLPEAGLIPV